MTDYEANLTAAQFKITPAPLDLAVARTQEMWQFFAFIFAALLTIAFTFIEEVHATGWRIAGKIAMSLGIAYFTLLSPRGRNFLIRVLLRFKTL
jgi:hypothetical protein